MVTKQDNSHGQPKLLAFCNTRNWDKCTWETAIQGISPSDESEKPTRELSRLNSTPRIFPPRMRRRQLRANLLYRITLSRLQFSNASLAHYAETHAFLFAGSAKSQLIAAVFRYARPSVHNT